MKKILYFLFCTLFFHSSVWALDVNVKRLESKPVSEFTPPPIEQKTFANGFKLYFLANHELPLFQMSALIRVGVVDESASEQGVASMMVAGLQTGGTTKLSGDEVDRKMESVAADLSSKVSQEYATLEVKCLVADVDLVLPLFFELLKNPTFDAKKLELIRQQMYSQIKERNEKPMAIAERKFAQALYGANNIWAREYSKNDVEHLTRDQVIDFYKSHVGPGNIMLAVSGDLSWNDISQRVEKQISTWQGKNLAERTLSPVNKEWNAHTYLIPKTSNQSSVIIGHFGDKRFSPDKYPLILANHILGGFTFGSKLGNRIRTELGLAYSVASRFGMGTDFGLFQISVGTKSESTLKVAEEVKKILSDMVAGNISEKELEYSKNTILNQLIFQYEDPFEIVSDRVMYDFYGYPSDYLSVYQKAIKAVTLQQVKEVAEKYFYPNKLVTLIVGDKQKVGDLSSLGNVETLSLDDK